MHQSFFDKVYEIVKQIPKGKVMTYKGVAFMAGSPGASRAVGTAMKNNPDMKTIPCHRVAGSDGKMHGYAIGNGVETKIQLLKKEGVSITGNKADLESCLFK